MLRGCVRKFLDARALESTLVILRVCACALADFSDRQVSSIRPVVGSQPSRRPSRTPEVARRGWRSFVDAGSCKRCCRCFSRIERSLLSPTGQPRLLSTRWRWTTIRGVIQSEVQWSDLPLTNPEETTRQQTRAEQFPDSRSA